MNINEKKVPSFQNRFKAPFYLKNSHMQTIFTSYLRFKNELSHIEKIVDLEVSKENYIRLKYALNPEGKSRILILIHGLEGSADANYIKRAGNFFYEKGYSILKMNMRTCGGNENISKTLYNAGLSEDIKKIYSYLVSQGFKEMYFFSYSLGANMVAKTLGEWGHDTPIQIKGAVLVSPPMDLQKSVEKLKLKQNFFYDWHFTKSLKIKFLKKHRQYPDLYPLQMLENVRDLFSFDDSITSKCFNYRDAFHYYRENSSATLACRISVPTLILASRDDPLICIETLENLKREEFPYLEIYLSNNGGHVGFWGKGVNSNSSKYWLEESALSWFNNSV